MNEMVRNVRAAIRERSLFTTYNEYVLNTLFLEILQVACIRAPETRISYVGHLAWQYT